MSLQKICDILTTMVLIQRTSASLTRGKWQHTLTRARLWLQEGNEGDDRVFPATAVEDVPQSPEAEAHQFPETLLDAQPMSILELDTDRDELGNMPKHASAAGPPASAVSQSVAAAVHACRDLEANVEAAGCGHESLPVDDDDRMWLPDRAGNVSRGVSPIASPTLPTCRAMCPLPLPQNTHPRPCDVPQTSGSCRSRSPLHEPCGEPGHGTAPVALQSMLRMLPVDYDSDETDAEEEAMNAVAPAGPSDGTGITHTGMPAQSVAFAGSLRLGRGIEVLAADANEYAKTDKEEAPRLAASAGQVITASGTPATAAAVVASTEIDASRNLSNNPESVSAQVPASRIASAPAIALPAGQDVTAIAYDRSRVTGAEQGMRHTQPNLLVFRSCLGEELPCVSYSPIARQRQLNPFPSRACIRKPRVAVWPYLIVILALNTVPQHSWIPQDTIRCMQVLIYLWL